MRVSVKLFAVVREKAGVGELSIDLPEGATVATAAEALAVRLPGVGEYLRRAAFAVNRSYAPPASPLREGDELAIIPPVSGG
jgi:MoaE-MoaD fusion protein